MVSIHGIYILWYLYVCNLIFKYIYIYIFHMIPTSGAWLFSQPQKGWRAQHWSGFDAPHPPKHRRKAVPQFREVVLVTFQFITWRCPKMGGPLVIIQLLENGIFHEININKPSSDILGIPPFIEPPICFITCLRYLDVALLLFLPGPWWMWRNLRGLKAQRPMDFEVTIPSSTMTTLPVGRPCVH